MANKISVIIEATVDKATAGINGFKKAIDDADGATGKFKAGAGAAFDFLQKNAGVAALAAGAALFKFGSVAVDAASSLEESMNAVNVTFGESADAIHALGQTSVNSFGLSTRAFNDAAVQFSAFAKQVAGPGGDVADTMSDLMGRAVDFASVMNLDVSEAMGIFQSTLAGETEPIRRFGKDISAAAVELYAMETGLISSKSEMTEAIKVQARFGLLMRETKDVAGDFANTSDGLANAQRRLKASLENLSAEAGQTLTPALAQVVDKMVVMVELADKLGGVFSFVGHVANTSAKSADEYEQSLNDLGYATDAVTGEQYKLSEATEASRASMTDYTESAIAQEQASINSALAQQKLTNETVAAEAALDDHTQAIQQNNAGLQEAYDKLHNVTAAFADLRGEMSDRSGFLSIQTSFDELQTKGEEALWATGAGWEDAEQKARDYEQKQIDVKEQVIAYAEEVGNIPPTALTDIIAAIDRGELAEAERLLANLANPGGKARNAFIKTVVQGRGMPEFAGGTNFAPGGAALVGEDGPEIVELPRGSKVHTASASAAMIGSPSAMGVGGSPIYLTVNAGMGANGKLIGQDIINAILAHERRSGPGWRQS